MKQEYYMFIIAGLLILAYLLDAVTNPLSIALTTPYHYFTYQNMFTYAFTTTSIVMKSIALFMAPFWVMTLGKMNPITKGAILVVIGGLLQLYALQDVVSGATIVPLEWSLAFTLTGIALLIPAVLFFIIGVLKKAGSGLGGDEEYYEEEDDDDDE